MSKELKKYFAIKFADEINEYVGCKISKSSDNSKILVSQPQLIDTLENIEIWEPDPKVTIPARPGVILQRAIEESKIVGAKEHRSYREAVGKLLYVATKTRPEICNAVRELSKT